MSNIATSDIGSSTYDLASSTIGAVGDTSTVVIANVASNVKARLPMIIASSLSLIAGLAWNSFFNSIINYYVPNEYRVKYSAWIKVAYAFLLTSIIIIVINIILYYMPSNKKPVGVVSPSYQLVSVK